MADRFQPISVPTKILAQSLSSSGTTFKLNNILDWNGDALTSAAFGTYAWAVFRNVTNTQIEFMRIDPTTIASASITIIKRGLGFQAGGDYDTEITANKYDWNANETYVELGSNPPQIYNEMAGKNNDETITGLWGFSQLPSTTAGNPVADNDLVRKAYADGLALGGATVNKVVTAGTAGETVSAGNLVYLKESDGRWWKCDADTAATVSNIVLGIAQGAGTAGNAITGGVLTYGLDSNQAGLTANSIAYAGNTAGAIVSTTPGTTEVTVGYSTSTTTVFFAPRYNQELTEDQQDALAGSSGTPSTSNRYVTENDVSAAGVPSKIVRSVASGKIPGDNDRSIDTAQTAGATITGATTPVPVMLLAADAEWYATDANDTARLRFEGFAISDSTDGNPITIQTSGIVAGFTGLTDGAQYYVQNAVGTIGTSVGTYTIPVGVAISTTQLVIIKKPLIVAGSGTNQTSVTTENKDETITVGFRPRLIILKARVGAQVLNNNPGDIGSSTDSIVFYDSSTALTGIGGSNTNATSGADIPFAPLSNGLSNSGIAFVTLGATASGSGTYSTSLSVLSVSATGFILRSQFTNTAATQPAGDVRDITWIAYE